MKIMKRMVGVGVSCIHVSSGMYVMVCYGMLCYMLTVARKVTDLTRKINIKYTIA